MKLIVQGISLSLLLMTIGNCSRVAMIRQEWMERQLRERVVRFFDAVRNNDCEVILQMHDRRFREGVIPEYHQELCTPVKELTGATLSFRKITISDDRQAAIIDFTVQYATPMSGEASYDWYQAWIREDGEWHLAHVYSPVIEIFRDHFVTSKNYDPMHPIFHDLPLRLPR